MEQKQVNGGAPFPGEFGTGNNAGQAQIQQPAGLDDLLDEIEELVAEDAQSFVQGFVQKGGE